MPLQAQDDGRQLVQERVRDELGHRELRVVDEQCEVPAVKDLANEVTRLAGGGRIMRKVNGHLVRTRGDLFAKWHLGAHAPGPEAGARDTEVGTTTVLVMRFAFWACGPVTSELRSTCYPRLP